MGILEKKIRLGEKMKQFFLIMGIVFSLTLAACTKVVVYGSDNLTESLSRRYTASKSELFAQCIRALDQMGYNLNEINEEQGQIVTGWRATTSNSHYLKLFGHKDFSANAGAYYQLLLRVEENGPMSNVEVNTRVKSISGKLTSFHSLEKDFLAKLSNFMRSPQIEITNVGEKDK